MCNDIIESKNILIHSCKLCKPSFFTLTLLSPCVKVFFPNKMRFYRYFKSVLNEAKKEKPKEGLFLKIEDAYEVNFNGGKNYCFYSSTNKGALIVLEIKETEEHLLIEIHPF